MESDTENHDTVMANPLQPFKPSTIPSTPQPLQQISPERQNQRRLPQSPSLPLFLDGHASPKKSHQHRLSDASDVKARVAFLNSISQTNSPTRPESPTKPSNQIMSQAAIQRAILGREEAESTLATLTAQLESAQSRERLVSERVESLIDQLSEARNRQRHERAVYEKEIKQSKKTEYKAELAVIKLQEDLRETKSDLENCKARGEHEKSEKDKARQEAFERAYVVAGMTEEVQELKKKLEVTERERDTAIAMANSQLQMATRDSSNSSVDDRQQAGAKRKEPTTDTTNVYYDEMDLEATDCPIEVKYTALQGVVEFLRKQLHESQETIHFMNMQCQFKACPCRTAERDGVRFVHDYEYDAKMRAQHAKRRKVEDLEPQRPLPIFKSWSQKREEAKGKQTSQQRPSQATEPSEAGSRMVGVDHAVPSDIAMTEAESVAKEVAAPLPPVDVKVRDNEHTGHSAVLEEAISIPLPSLKPMEIDSSDDTPEPTAQLEELTQVIVEPDVSSKNFLFSASTSSNRAAPEQVVDGQQSRHVRMSDDLFDISPPKRQMPPRPSTAMGVLTVESPVQLMPQSPHVQQQRSLTPEGNLPPQQTTRVALNDTSPVRQSRQHRQQPQAVGKDHSRGRSPARQRHTELDRSSPAPTTFFAITPVTKHERKTRRPHIEPRPQTVQGYYPDDVKETSTTTTVPLRDETEYLSRSTSSEGPKNIATATETPFSVPGTPNMTREAALAQIRARRDRARSVNMRKSAEDGNKTPGSVARRGVNLKERLGDVKGRDFSQASAPGRI